MSTSKLVEVTLSSLAALALCGAPAEAQSQNQPTQSTTKQDSKTTATKKAGTNPKKPAEAKNNGDADKVKTDERMSTRGLKPPPKDDDKKTSSDKPDSPPKQ